MIAQYGLAVRGSREVRGVLRIETNAGPHCLKRCRLTEEELWFSQAAMEHLRRCGYEGVIPHEWTVAGLPFARHGPHLYTLTRWMDSRELDFDDPRDLNLAVRTLAEFHQAARGFVPPPYPQRVLWGAWPARFSSRADQLLEWKEAASSREHRSAFDEVYLQEVYYYHQQGLQALELLGRSPYHSLAQAAKDAGTLCHHDISPYNFLLGADNRVYLVDFDYCICDLHLHDLGSLILRTLKRSHWDYGEACAVAEAYDRILPLSDGALQVLEALFRWPQDFWQVGLQYYVEHQPWTLDRFLNSLAEKIKGPLLRERFLARYQAEHFRGLNPAPRRPQAAPAAQRRSPVRWTRLH